MTKYLIAGEFFSSGGATLYPLIKLCIINYKIIHTLHQVLWWLLATQVMAVYCNIRMEDLMVDNHMAIPHLI